MKKSKQLSIGLVPTTLILAAITLGFILLFTGSQPATINKVSTPPVSQRAPAINSSAGLDAAAKELDSTDPAQLDQELNALSADSNSL